MEYSDKFLQCIGQYEPVKSIQTISEIVDSILKKNYKNNCTPEVLKKIYGCIDLTRLNSLDTKETICHLVEKINKTKDERSDLPNVAGICTYPIFISTVKQALTASNVKIVSVAGGFPSSQTFPEVKIAEIAMAVMEGAEEIDVVMNLGAFIENSFEMLTDEINEMKVSCREAKLKVILETGALSIPDNIQRATVLALHSGADFIKTSTGKEYPGASYEAVYTICKTIKQYEIFSGNKAGIKISGGIRSVEEAVKYYTLIKETLGKEWITNNLFRIGSSNLATNIEKYIDNQ